MRLIDWRYACIDGKQHRSRTRLEGTSISDVGEQSTSRRRTHRGLVESAPAYSILLQIYPPPLESNCTQKSAVSRTQQVFWPKEYLAEDISQARVWTYGYNADVIGGLFQANDKNCVSAHGRDLAVRLEREIDNEVTSPTAKSRNASVDMELVPHYIYSPQPGRHPCQRRKTRVLLSNLTR